MSPNKSWVALMILLSITLVACGQKGPLYIPQPSKPPAADMPAAPDSPQKTASSGTAESSHHP